MLVLEKCGVCKVALVALACSSLASCGKPVEPSRSKPVELSRFLNPYVFHEREDTISAQGEWFKTGTGERSSKIPAHVEVFFSREHGEALVTTVFLDAGWVATGNQKLPITEWTPTRIKAKREGLRELSVDREKATVFMREFESDGTINTYELRK